MNTIKAKLLDDDAVRILAFPFSGPIPSPHHRRGVDIEGETFTERTDIKPDWFKARPVDWHHGQDGKMGRHVIGKAVDLEMDEDGWWVTAWLKHGDRRRNLVARLQEAGAVLYGSSEAVPGMVKASTTGEILQWPYWRQTLSTSPVNTHSVVEPVKASVDELMATAYPPTQAFYADLRNALTDLEADLRSAGAKATPDLHVAGAYAGRVEPVLDLRETSAQVERLRMLLDRRA